jgi:hypothetical protein
VRYPQFFCFMASGFGFSPESILFLLPGEFKFSQSGGFSSYFLF